MDAFGGRQRTSSLKNKDKSRKKKGKHVNWSPEV